MTVSNPKVYLEFGTRTRLLGRIVIELFKDVVPRTVDNFTRLMETKYRGCRLHRIIPGFVIQGGDFERGDGTGGYSIYGRHFEDENFQIKHSAAGLLSMANSGPDTNGSQFFITLDAAPHLDNKHVVFGRIINGFDTVEKVEKLGSVEGTPTETVKIVKCGKV